jgi:hypothetical protein
MVANRIENARVHTDDKDAQSTLFPLSPFTRKPPAPREVCKRINLNWLAAIKLYESGLLSFDPAAAGEMTPTQEAELIFLGSLVAGGCDENLLRQLVTGLSKPYAYRIDRIFFDWETQAWDVRPGNADRGVQFDAWLEELVEAGEMRTLETLRAGVDRAISDLRRLTSW